MFKQLHKTFSPDLTIGKDETGEDTMEGESDEELVDEIFSGEDNEAEKRAVDEIFADKSGKEGEDRETENIEQPESTKEFYESVNTVEELLSAWTEKYEQTNDQEEKRELAFKILRMDMALGVARLKADEVKVANFDDAYGFYLPATGELAITPEGLELPAEHYADVLVHESAHAGRLTGKRIFDEGMAELKTAAVLPDALGGFYEAEQGRVKRTFGEDAALALRNYDFDKPTNLAKMYLETEWRDRWNEKIKGEFKKAEEAGAKFFADAVKKGPDIEKHFKDGVPELYQRLKEEGFNFREAGSKILKRLSRE